MLHVSHWPRRLTATAAILVAIALGLGLFLALADILAPPDSNVAGFEVDGDLCVDTLPDDVPFNTDGTADNQGRDWARLGVTGCPSGPDDAVFVPAVGGADFVCRG